MTAFMEKAEHLEVAGGDFRFYLQSELVHRIRENPQYSLRAFSRFLQVDPSLLSKIINGKRKISRKLLLSFTSKLELSPAVVRQFTGEDDFVTAEGNFQQVTVDHFHLISDWYHYAIFELIELEHFRPQPRWVAKALGISIPQVSAAVERLVRLGFIEIDKRGQWRRKVANITTVDSPFTATAFRKMQRQCLLKAIEALEETPFERRDQSFMTMAVDSSLIPEVRTRIRKFRRQISDFFQSRGRADHVYNLGISFYPVTRLDKEAEI